MVPRNDSYITERKEGHDKCTVSSQSEHEVSGRDDNKEVSETEVELTAEQLIWNKRNLFNKRQNEDKETGTSAKKKREKESEKKKGEKKDSQRSQSKKKREPTPLIR